MRIRLRQVPIETTEAGSVYLSVATKLMPNPDTTILMGPAVLEYTREGDGRPEEWLPIEIVKL